MLQILTADLDEIMIYNLEIVDFQTLQKYSSVLETGTESQQWWYTLWTADHSFLQGCVKILSKDNISAFLLYSVVRAGERQERWHSGKALACTMGCSPPPELPWSPLSAVAQCVCPTLLGLLEQCWALITLSILYAKMSEVIKPMWVRQIFRWSRSSVALCEIMTLKMWDSVLCV